MATVEEMEALKAQLKQMQHDAEEMRLERIGLGETIKKQSKRIAEYVRELAVDRS